MKCFIAAAVLTFVIAVHSSVIPISPISLVGPTILTSHPGIVLGHPSHVVAIAAAPAPNKSIAIHASTAPATAVIAAAPEPNKSIAIHASTAPATAVIAAAPAPAIIAAHSLLEIAGPQPHAITLAHAPAIIAAAPAPTIVAAAPAPAIIAAEGQYVAQTRGAVHSAPLPGHINSASSINLEPAPGTL